MGNGVYFKMIGCCRQNKNPQTGDIEIDKNNLIKIPYNNYKNKNSSNNYISEVEIQNKKDQKIIATKSKISSGSGSMNKVKQIYLYMKILLTKIKIYQYVIIHFKWIIQIFLKTI